MHWVSVMVPSVHGLLSHCWQFGINIVEKPHVYLSHTKIMVLYKYFLFCFLQDSFFLIIFALK